MPNVDEKTRVKKTFEATIKGINVDDYTVDVEVSDGSIDRDEEIILPSAYVARLGSYLANPILCWSHPLCSEEPEPEDCIGKALSVSVTGNALACKFQYAVEENEKAALIWRLVSGGYLKAFSIGALVYDYVSFWDAPEDIAALGGAAGEALRTGQVWRVITDCELVEISQVLVGSNRNALIRAFKSEKMGPMNSLKSLFTRGLPPSKKAKDKVNCSIECPECGNECPDGCEECPECGYVFDSVQAPKSLKKSSPSEDEQFEALLNENPELAEAFLEIVEEFT